MSHWSRVLRRLNKRRKTTHAYHDENIGGSPVLLPSLHPGPIITPIPVLTLRDNKPAMDIDARTHQPQSSTDSSQRWVSAEEGPLNPPPESKDPASWGANFWVTIIDPQTQNHFYACPSTGECSWDPPAGNFVLPPSTEGEWWELNDESRSPPVPYYHHTRTGETSWTRPVGTFVIPLGIVQTTTLGRRLSRNTHHPTSSVASAPTPAIRQISEDEEPPTSPRSRAASTTLTPPTAHSSRSNRRTTSEYLRPHVSTLPPIPASPFNSVSAVDLPSNSPITPDAPNGSDQPHLEPGRTPRVRTISTGTTRTARSTGAEYLQGQSEHSLDAAAAGIVSGGSGSDNGIVPGDYAPTTRMLVPDSTLGLTAQAKGKGVAKEKETDGEPESTRSKRTGAGTSVDSTGLGLNGGGILISRPLSEQIPRTKSDTAPPAPPRMTSEYPAWAMSDNIQPIRLPVDFKGGNVKIGAPIMDPEAAASMSPINHERARPIPVEPISTKRLSTGDHKMLPRRLAEDIQQFQVSDFARRYFSTHKTGLIFRRRVPVEQLMVWQKQPLTSPLLILNRSLHKDAVLIFKVIQRIMGDRERDRPVGVRVQPSESHLAAMALPSDPSASPGRRGKAGVGKIAGTGGDVLEEERWLLAEGIEHGELRDEIYCQVVKQLTDNPSPESTFRGWQLLCVLLVTFPPSKNFEGYLRSFMLGKIKQTEGRIDVMAKYCLHRLPVIAKKGPRGKPPTAQEITNASDSAFNPSTFGESLSAIMRLQERTYGSSKVPIILPFLADGILALGGTKSEGIFRIPGDGDAVSDLRVRIDKGFYNLEGIDDCNVPASLFKLWLRELQEPLIPSDMYNPCIESAEDPERVVALVRALPPNNRRVLLFVISFLQLFLPDHVQSVTKMTSANLALVMAPNLLRCDSESMAIVFTNARFEHIFVHNLLLHLKCSKIDPDYVPIHGLGASASGPQGAPRASQSRNRTKSHRDSAGVGGR